MEPVYLVVSFHNIESYSIVKDTNNKLKNQKKANVLNKIDNSWKKGDILSRGSKENFFKYCQAALSHFNYIDMNENDTDLEQFNEMSQATKQKSNLISYIIFSSIKLTYS